MLPAVLLVMADFGPNGIDRRQHPRVRFCAEAVISEGGRTLGPVSIQNLSLQGALLVGDVEPVVASTVQVTVASGKLRGASFQAEVRWAVIGAGFVKFGVRILPEQSPIARLIQDIVLGELEQAGRDTGGKG